MYLSSHQLYVWTPHIAMIGLGSTTERNIVFCWTICKSALGSRQRKQVVDINGRLGFVSPHPYVWHMLLRLLEDFGVVRRANKTTCSQRIEMENVNLTRQFAKSFVLYGYRCYAWRSVKTSTFKKVIRKNGLSQLPSLTTLSYLCRTTTLLLGSRLQISWKGGYGEPVAEIMSWNSDC